MTPISFLIAAAVLTVIGTIIVAWAERAEGKEREKLRNYRRAEMIGFYRSRKMGISEHQRGI